MDEKIIKAFVFPFSTHHKTYIYDVNTNSIVNVPLSIYTAFKERSCNTLSLQDHSLLQTLFNKGFFKPNPILHIEHPITPVIQAYLERKIQSITLQLTQQCNLRCKYCAYSGEYSTRQHSDKYMSLDTAKASIDFLLSHSIDSDYLNIGFYGGEPLLCFKLLKEIVAYVKKNSEGKKILFNITTNGTLFNDRNISFLQEHNFTVMISLDGPKEIHDKNRVFASNGKGTFSTIMNKLAMIKTSYPKFYSNLTLNAVMDPTTSHSCASNFFIGCSEIEGLPISASIISAVGKKHSVDIDESFLIEEMVENFKFMLYKLGRLSIDKISTLAESRFNQMLSALNMARVISRELPKVIHPSGPCIPGARKLMIDVDGNFYPCESVPEKDFMQIGNLKDGFNYNQVLVLLNIGQISAEKCKMCWGIRLCTQCCFGAATDSGLSKEKRLSECNNILKSHEENLKDFCTLREHGYNFTSDMFKMA